MVTPDMAAATSLPASTARFTCRATLRMRSRSATDVPPNFITRRGIGRPGRGAMGRSGHAGPTPKKARIHNGGLAALQQSERLSGGDPDHGQKLGYLRQIGG